MFIIKIKGIKKAPKKGWTDTVKAPIKAEENCFRAKAKPKDNKINANVNLKWKRDLEY